VPFAAGIALGALVGQMPIALSDGLRMRLDLASGAFLVALPPGHSGHLGLLRLHVPDAVKHFAHGLGLVIFLAGAGTVAGQVFVPVIRVVGLTLLVAGTLVTRATRAATQPADPDTAAVGFARGFPVAVIAEIILAPLIFLLLRMC
jgi:uncharacterized transporter YbjL